MKIALSALVAGAVAGLVVTVSCGGSKQSATNPTVVRAYSRGRATIIAADPRDSNVKGAMALVVE